MLIEITGESFLLLLFFFSFEKIFFGGPLNEAQLYEDVFPISFADGFSIRRSAVERLLACVFRFVFLFLKTFFFASTLEKWRDKL